MSPSDSSDCANPLLLQCLQEIWEKARQQNTRGAMGYKKAYDSMKACPITFEHPSQAQQLRGIGKELVKRMTEFVEDHCRENGLPMPKNPSRAKRRAVEDALDPTGAPEPPPRKKAKPKAYVPALRTGPYAIILALSTVDEGSSIGISKTQLIDLAQPLCDASFTAPPDPSKFYTAWASMKTLQAKELVYESGRPTRKYYLTDEGWEVARRLRAANDSRDPVSAPTQHLDLQDLQSGVEETDGRINQRRTTNKRQDRPPQKQSNDKPQIGLGLGSPSATPQSRRLGRTDREPDFFEILSSPPPGPAADVRRHWEKFGTSNGRTSSNVVTSTATKESNSLSGTSSGRTSSNVVTSMVTKESNSLPGFDPIYIVPGTFTVELIIDNREVRAKQDRDYIQNGLISRGVKVTTRALEVGDAIWVARLHDPTVLTKAGEEGDEIVLDWIVERKRLDDLIGSIKDGRFTEQKFRLRKSGARNVVYLIEDIGLAAESEQGFHEHIQSAIASTQVVNGFFVKRTPKVDDTIAYLARMTKMLKQQYEGEMLSVIPSTQLSSETYLPLLATLDSPHYITYNSFAAMASKTDSLTLRDIFLKMLMCTRGITGEKAIEIQKHWSTPCEFIEAMAQFERSADKATASNQRKDMVFNAAGNLVGRRKIGKAFSAKLGETWGEY